MKFSELWNQSQNFKLILYRWCHKEIFCLNKHRCSWDGQRYKVCDVTRWRPHLASGENSFLLLFDMFCNLRIVLTYLKRRFVLPGNEWHLSQKYLGSGRGYHCCSVWFTNPSSQPNLVSYKLLTFSVYCCQMSCKIMMNR